MKNKQTKKATVDAINVMIRHADKGPSGFWVENHEGCETCFLSEQCNRNYCMMDSKEKRLLEQEMFRVKCSV